MKSLSKYINEAKDGVIADLKIGETIYILCLSKSNKPVSAKIKNIEVNQRGNAFSIELDKEVFGAKWIDYTVTKAGALGMGYRYSKRADPDNWPVYNGGLMNGKTVLGVIFGRSKEEIKEMVDSSYGDNLKEMQEKADNIYKEYLEQIDKIREFTQKIYVDMSDDDPDDLG